MSNDVNTLDSTVDSKESLVPKSQNPSEENGDANNQQESQTVSKEAIIEDLKKRRAGEQKKINELVQENKELAQKVEQFNNTEQNTTEDKKAEIVEIEEEKGGEKIETIINEKLEQLIPSYLGDNKTIKKLAEKEAKEDEASLRLFKEKFPDAYNGDNLTKDLDEETSDVLASLIKADVDKPLGELAEIAFATTRPDEYKKALNSDSYAKAEMSKFSGIGGSGRTENKEVELSDIDKAFLKQNGVKIKK